MYTSELKPLLQIIYSKMIKLKGKEIEILRTLYFNKNQKNKAVLVVSLARDNRQGIYNNRVTSLNHLFIQLLPSSFLKRVLSIGPRKASCLFEAEGCGRYQTFPYASRDVLGLPSHHQYAYHHHFQQVSYLEKELPSLFIRFSNNYN